MITVRVRGPAGTTTLRLEDTAVARDLVEAIARETGVSAGAQEVKFGRPLKTVDLSSADTPIKALGIASGEVLVVASVAGVSTPARPAPATNGPASSAPKPAPAPAPAPVARPASERHADGRTGQARPLGGSEPSERPAPTRVTARFGDQHLILRRVPDDNSCLFHAAALVLTPGVTDGATKLRRIVADAILADPVTYSEAVLGQPPDAYAKKMAGPNAWGGAIELAILSDHAQTEIDSVDIKSGRIDRFGEGRWPSRVLLVYAGIHYDALTASFVAESDAQWPYRDDALAFDVLSFDASDDSVLIAAQAIADQLRKAHAYTDTATFTLKCGDCGKGLTGEKAALEHAKLTGHASFTEYS